MAVFVLDKQKRPLMPCTEKRARLLLERGRAVVVRLAPFTIRLKDRIGGAVQPLRLKLDPGSRTTGLALVRESETIDPDTGAVERVAHVRWLGELTHRGHQIREALTARAAFRRRRRTANLRHRAPRFDNRTRPAGWLAPSLRHQVETTANWVARLRRLAPLSAIGLELVRFDMQAMQNPEISGVEYQQGTLAGYEVREYLLENWHRTCAYCGATNVPLEIEHIVPRSNGGSNRVSNLTLACSPCNRKKGAQPVEVFLKGKPEVLRRIQAQAKAPLKDSAAVNATRWALFGALQATGLPVETGSGGRTKFNRTRLDIPKTHALDAACVGQVDTLSGWQCPTLAIRATGRGRYQRTRPDRFGFPRGYLMRHKRVHGVQTGDRVIARVPTGKKAGVHVGRVAVRARGVFNIQTAAGVVDSLSHRHCRVLQRADGYGYAFNPKTLTEEARRAA
ncbi:RRXRR domain-containing protein [Allochromatium humboldtianum]|uniref:RRXRR domain-containing protein n=1 Tax=Allochromatium humboldtianum TaxID=504901 RepID=A0A850RKM0_9GAMM|nr:RNA-guided endonuclease IscB [Allochromatium humboldtianum]NVZ11652.1 RRXRR domain-containing protein [Allochromatium humboldtianum]